MKKALRRHGSPDRITTDGLRSYAAAMDERALRLAKGLLRQGQSTSFETALEMAASAQALAHLTADHNEGVNALLENRPPDFSGD